MGFGKKQHLEFKNAKKKSDLGFDFVFYGFFEFFWVLILIILLLLFRIYSRQETNILSPEGLSMSNSVVY
jgi:hypothetical protein